MFKVLMLVTLVGCSALGSKTSDKQKKKFEKSKQFNSKTGEFENRRPNIVKEMEETLSRWDLFKKWYSQDESPAPSGKLPEIKPDLVKFLEKDDTVKSIWFGHSTFLLNFHGKIILVDPVFSGSASPVSFLVKRFQPPVLKLNELPPVDYVLISHDHYDHLDMESIEFLSKTDATFITPLGVSAHLESWGVDKDKIIEKDWWKSYEVTGLNFICTPAQHFSGRGGFSGNETLWSSWIIQNKKSNIFFSGDSGYDTHFKEIGNRYGPFDIAYLESGQYSKDWEAVHMLPEQGAQAYMDLKAKMYFPVHWGMFVLSFHKWNDPVVQLTKLKSKYNINLVTPRIGEIIDIHATNTSTSWWDI
jgi:L-ascorbate metabolism protein UlaG (beta-lactamase superfamily)